MARRLPDLHSPGIIVAMSELPPPTVPPAPTPVVVAPDNFFRNLIILVVLGIAAFGGYKAYDSAQDTKEFNRHQVEMYRKAINGD